MTQLGNGECEECQIYFIHKKNNNNCFSECSICQSQKDHKARSLLARTEYKADAARPYSAAHRIMSADLQKVILDGDVQDCNVYAKHLPF